jgi:crotonobetainyl-CoA:carnitine CoA-transferase CaiB-like acyl-CoA transferase
MPEPFAGIRILDLTSMISGPLATMTLADQGADVIKVEAPGEGDHARVVTTRRGGFSASFLNNNRNKRSVVLDLKQPLGRTRHPVAPAEVSRWSGQDCPASSEAISRTPIASTVRETG